MRRKDSRRDEEEVVIPVRTGLIETVSGVKRGRLRENRGRLREGVGERKAECKAV